MFMIILIITFEITSYNIKTNLPQTVYILYLYNNYMN